MPRLSMFLAAAVSCFCLLSCNPEPSAKETKTDKTPEFDKEQAKQFIDSINLKFSAEIASGDSAALASHYWPDAELLLDNSEAVKGSDIKNAWGAAIRMGLKEMNLSTTDIRANEKFIIETGHYEMKAAGKTLIDKGKYVVVWENRNGEWKLYRDIGCTSMPAAR